MLLISLKESNKMSLEKVTKWMIDRHNGQTRKNKINGNILPYFFHPIQVANLVFKFGAGTEDNMMAALCHDILEDTETTEQELLDATNQNVVDIVKELTWIPLINPQSNVTKEQYMLSFETASIDALIIKIADRLCNVADFKLTSPEYAETYFLKASPLFEFFEKRQTEVCKTYNLHTFWKIMSMILYVRNKVSENYLSEIIL